jgi:deoxyribonuclease V
VLGSAWKWPASETDLITFQSLLALWAHEASSRCRWAPPPTPRIAGCSVAFAPHAAGSNGAGDQAWAAAVLWRPDMAAIPRRSGRQLRGTATLNDMPRQARDIDQQTMIAARAPAPYVPGLLARREGAIMARVLDMLTSTPDAVMVDATGEDHPRRAGLAIHLGYAVGLPSIGVTARPLLARGEWPPLTRGRISPLWLGGRVVAYWVCTRTGARPVIAHAGWRTDARTAADIVLAASTESARTPVPLQEARRVAREARALASRTSG